MYRDASLARLGACLAATLILFAGACTDAAVSPDRDDPSAIGFSRTSIQAVDTVRITGVGSLGTGPATPGSPRQDFDLDVASTLSGRVFLRDWGVIRGDGSAGSLTVSPADTATRTTAFRTASTVCADPTRGVEFDGIGRVNTGGDSDPSGNEWLAFTIVACDNGPAESGADVFQISVPSHGYSRGPDQLVSGDLVKASAGTLPPGGTGDLVVTTSTTGSNLDPDGFTVTVDGSNTQPIPTSGSVTFRGLAAGDHSVALGGVAENCAASAPNPRTVTVISEATATTTFGVSCAAPAPNQPPSVNAGPDETVLIGLFYRLSAAFSDPDNDGPWWYTIDWGDGSATTGTTASQSMIGATHSYLLPGRYSIRVTVVDSHGAAGSDTKLLTVLL